MAVLRWQVVKHDLYLNMEDVCAFSICVCVCVCAYLPLCVDMGVIKLLKPALCLMGDCIVCCRLGFKGIKTLLLTWISSIRPSQYHTSTQRPSGCTHTHAFLFSFHHAVKWDYTTVDPNLSHLFQKTPLKALPWVPLRDGTPNEIL